MKSRFIVCIACAMLLNCGCSLRDNAGETSKRDREARIRAEAARKEMEALPKAFQTPDFFKKNEPEKKIIASPAQK